MSIFGSLLDYAREALLPVVVTAVTGTVVAVGHRVAGWFKAKTGVDIDDRVTAVLDKGIAAAKEHARNYFKEHGKELANSARKSYAARFVAQKLKALKLPTFAIDLIEKMIEARIAELRAAAAKPHGPVDVKVDTTITEH